MKKEAAIQRAVFDFCSDSHFRAITRELPVYFLGGMDTEHFLTTYHGSGQHLHKCAG